MLVTDALMAWFLALGFSAPTVVTQRDSTVTRWRWQTGAAVLATITVSFLSCPHLFSCTVSIARSRRMRRLLRLQRTSTSWQGVNGSAGFWSLQTSSDFRVDVPALPWSKFVELIQMTRLEEEVGPFLKDLAGQAPFALVTGVRFNGPRYATLYIAPAKVIEQRDAWAWQLTLVPRQPNSSLFLSPRSYGRKVVVI